MVALHSQNQADQTPVQEMPEDAFAFINFLRFVSMRCRVKRQTSLFEACALLHVERNATREACGEALMRCLGEALGKPTKLHSPGIPDMSFDEAWLVQLGLSTARRDEMSVEFLLKSRVRHEHRRLVRFLITQISESFFCFDTMHPIDGSLQQYSN